MKRSPGRPRWPSALRWSLQWLGLLLLGALSLILLAIAGSGEVVMRRRPSSLAVADELSRAQFGSAPRDVRRARHD